MEFFKGNSGFGLVDEIEEEEFIERDEYVDGDEEVYDDYDDEYYEEDEYYEVEYPAEEEAYYDEGYDDGYDDYPQDDGKLDRVLNELAELRRSVSTAVPAYTHPQAPAHPYIITPPAANSNNEVAMYNEISRLRNELGKTQTSQEMHMELTRLKEQMERDSRQNEAGLLSEIRRLNERVAELSSPGGSAVKAASLPAGTGGGGGGGSVRCVGEEVLRQEFARLIDINEAILQTVKETETKSQAQIAEIRKRVASLPDLSSLSRSIEELQLVVDQFGGEGGDGMLRELQDVRIALSEGVGGGASVDTSAIESKIDEIKNAAPTTDNSELLRQIYELKSLIGSAAVGSAKRDRVILELYNGFSKVKAEVDSDIDLGEKLIVLDAFAEKLATTNELETAEIYRVLLSIFQRLVSEKLTRQTLESVKDFVSKVSAVSVPQRKLDAADSYVRIYDRVKRASILDSIDLLSDLVASVDELQEHTRRDQNDSVYEEILNLAEAYTSSTSENPSLNLKIKEKLDALCCVTVAELLSSYVPIKPPRSYKTVSPVPEGGALIDKLNELKNVISDLNVVSSGRSDAGAEGASASNSLVLQEINSLKADLYTLVNPDAILGEIRVLKSGYAEILRKLDNVNAPTDNFTTAEIADAVTQDIAYIKNRIGEQDAILSQLSELRADVLTLSVSGASTRTSEPSTVAQSDEVYGDLNTQLDKLYEDLASVILLNTDPLAKRIDEIAFDIAEIKKTVSSGAIPASMALHPQTTVNNDSLVTEISEIRNLLMEKNDAQTTEQSEALTAQVSTIVEKLEMLEAGLTTKEMPGAEATIIEESTMLLLNDINDKINSLLYGEGESPDNIQLIIAEITSIKETIDKMIDEAALREGGLGAGSTPTEESVMILEDLAAIKDKLNAGSQMTTSEIESVKEEVQASRMRDVEEIASELDKIYAELRQLRAGVSTEVHGIRSDITDYRDEVKTGEIDRVLLEIASLRDELKSESPENSEVNMILGEIVALRDEVQAYRDELSQIRNTVSTPQTIVPTQDVNSESVNLLFDELSSLRAEVQAYNEEILTSQRTEVDAVKASVDTLHETMMRTTEQTPKQAPPATSDELNLVLEELLNLKAERESDMREIKDILQFLMSEKTREMEQLQLTPETEPDSTAEDIAYIKDQLVEIGLNTTPKTDGAELMGAILEDITALREEVSMLMQSMTISEEARATDTTQNTDAIVLEELALLRDQVAAVSDILVETRTAQDVTTEQTMLDELAALRDQVAAVSDILVETRTAQDVTTEQTMLDELAALRDQVAAVSDILVETRTAQDVATEQTMLDELAALREQVAVLSETLGERGYEVTNMTAEANDAVILDEISVLKEQIATLNDLLSQSYAPTVQPGSQEPVVVDNSEILFEIGSLKEQILALGEKMEAERQGDGVLQTESVESTLVLDEINVIKEQLTALGDVVTQSYTMEQTQASEPITMDYTVVLDEITVLKDQINLLSEMMAQSYETALSAQNEEPTEPVTVDNSEVLGEIATLKNQIAALGDIMAENYTTVDAASENAEPLTVDNTELMGEIAVLKDQVSVLSDMLAQQSLAQAAQSDALMAADNSELMGEIAVLKDQMAAIGDILAEQSMADVSSQDAPMTVDNTELMGEIAVLKDQIAALGDILVQQSTLEAAQATPVEVDNSEILDEIDELKEQISALSDILTEQRFATASAQVEQTEQSDVPLSDESTQLLDEINTLKDQIAAIADILAEQYSDAETMQSLEASATDNTQVLQEISALKEQVLALGEIMASGYAQPDFSAQATQADGVYAVNNTQVLDEIAVLRNQLAAMNDLIAEGVMVQTQPQAESQQPQAVAYEPAAMAYDDTQVLDEIAHLRDQLTALNDLIAEGVMAQPQSQPQAESQQPQAVAYEPAAMAYDDTQVLGEIAYLRNQLTALNDLLAEGVASEAVRTADVQDTSIDGNAITEALDDLKERIEALGQMRSARVASEGDDEDDVFTDTAQNRDLSLVLDELSAIKEELLAVQKPAVATEPVDTEVLVTLTEDLAAMRRELSVVTELIATGQPIALDEDGEPMASGLGEKLAALSEQIEGLSTQTHDDSDLRHAVNLLFEELTGLKDHIATLSGQVHAGAETFATDAIMDNQSVQQVLEEVTALRTQLAENTQEGGGDATLLGEIVALHERIASLEDSLRTQTDDVPDLSVINEVMALRDEFQAFKDELNASRTEQQSAQVDASPTYDEQAERKMQELAERTQETAQEATQKAEAVLDEIKTLRDQLFAISMASVAGGDGATQYESYNNIILDELSALRQEVTRLQDGEALSGAVTSEIASIKESVQGASADSIAAIRSQLVDLSHDIETMKAVSERVEELRDDFAGFASANETLVNFMSEIAIMVERQNDVIQQMGGGSAAEIDEKLADMKQEIAATVTEASRGSIRELAKLKEEVARSKASSSESQQVLKEIRRIQGELAVLSERSERQVSTSRRSTREESEDRDLTTSINELKDELNQIAEMVVSESSVSTDAKKGTTKKRKTTATRRMSRSSQSTSKTGSSASSTKSSSSRSRSASTRTATRRSPLGSSRIEHIIEETDIEEIDESQSENQDLLSRIDQESIGIAERMEVSDGSSPATENTGTTLEVAEHLARQVANKLVMEQLVHQLGDGLVPESKVEEIVKDILPQEFSTIQIDEQSDKVRRLANSLVLDKLRSRLTGKKD